MKFIFNTKDNIQGIKDKKCIFVDGTSSLIDYSKDLELSHWIPNQTPDQYKADTSTQICLNYIQAGCSKKFDWVINNHVDADGILSAFVLLYPKISLQHQKVIHEASLMGDFSAYGDYDSTHFYLHLVESTKSWQKQKLSNQLIFEQAFQLILDYFNHAIYPYDQFAKDAFNQIEQSDQLLQTKQIIRKIINPSFVSYTIPYELICKSAKKAIYKSGFDFGLDTQQILPMQIMNRYDFEKQKLIIVENQSGDHYYDLLLPDYLWAQTWNLYRPKGIQSTESTNVHLVNRPDLVEVINKLQELEENLGIWTLATTFHPFASIKGRGFPVVLSFLDNEQIAPSSIDPKQVTQQLSDLW